MKHNIDTVIFDFDGTILDSEGSVAELARSTLSRFFERPVSEKELNYLKGKVWKYILMDWFPDNHREVYDEIVSEWERKRPRMYYYLGIEDLLKGLESRGIRLAIASSRETKYIHEILDELSIHNYFDAVIGQTDTQRHKPLPDPLLLAAARLEKDPKKCIYLGDQPTDVLASRAAGMSSGAALWGEGVYEEISSANPDFVFYEPFEVISGLFSDGDSADPIQ